MRCGSWDPMITSVNDIAPSSVTDRITNLVRSNANNISASSEGGGVGRGMRGAPDNVVVMGVFLTRSACKKAPKAPRLHVGRVHESAEREGRGEFVCNSQALRPNGTESTVRGQSFK